jgi:hypothetical protein
VIVQGRRHGIRCGRLAFLDLGIARHVRAPRGRVADTSRVARDAAGGWRGRAADSSDRSTSTSSPRRNARPPRARSSLASSQVSRSIVVATAVTGHPGATPLPPHDAARRRPTQRVSTTTTPWTHRMRWRAFADDLEAFTRSGAIVVSRVWMPWSRGLTLTRGQPSILIAGALSQTTGTAP